MTGTGTCFERTPDDIIPEGDMGMSDKTAGVKVASSDHTEIKDLKTRKKRELKRNLVAYSFIAPNFIGFAVFTLVPILFAFALAFMEWDGNNPIKFVGLENFKGLGQDIYLTGIPVKLSDTPGQLIPVFPALGEHTSVLMHSLGYSDEEINKLREEKAVR